MRRQPAKALLVDLDGVLRRWDPAVPAGVVPDPTPDPLSFYPTQDQTSAVQSPGGSAKWTTIKPRRSDGSGDSSSTGGTGASLASLWDAR